MMMLRQSSSRYGLLIQQRRLCSTHMISRLNDFERLKKSSFSRNSQNSSNSNINVSLRFNDEMICENMSVESHVTLKDLISEKLNKKTSKRLVAASVNGVLRDLNSKLTESENHVELHDVESEIGTETMWHSASHVLGYALEKQYGDSIALCDGPALRLSEGGSGFFYEMRLLSNDLKISPDDIPDIEAYMKDFVRQNHAFERLRVSKEDALRMFESNRLKREFIENIDESEDEITLYRCGDFVDLCRGPHVRGVRSPTSLRTSLISLVIIPLECYENSNTNTGTISRTRSGKQMSYLRSWTVRTLPTTWIRIFWKN